MKKCPACNRTYADDVYTFCLEDGSILSAPYEPQREQETILRPVREQETVLRPVKMNSAPENFFPQKKQPELPTLFADKSIDEDSMGQSNNINPYILIGIVGFFLVAALYTLSAIPLIIGFFVILVTVIVQMLIKKST